ncbi:MAG: substrate-binding domain-containing protein [Coriobacteriia bacterium]|nr:substrate-binding domain-containing protein [Coriobacteriia bacterium]
MDTVGTIDRHDQLSVLADEHRRAILRRLMCGPSTLSRLGREFDKHPAWIRHHLKRLEAVGLAEPAGEQKVRNYTEKFYRASAGAYAIHLLIGPDTGDRAPLMVLGSHDFALELLVANANVTDGHREIVPAAIGSLDGLVALRQGLADIAGCHLFDAEADEYNIPYLRHLFPDRRMAGLTLAHREQGLMTAPGNPLKIRGVEDLARPGLVLANRNPGSGTRVWLDRKLHDLGIDPTAIVGYDRPFRTHTEAALAIAAGEADAGLGIRAAAEESGLGFVTLFHERYDLIFDADRLEDPALAAFLDRLATRAFRTGVREIRGYETDHTGDALRLDG